jgi:hypothetical protein
MFYMCGKKKVKAVVTHGYLASINIAGCKPVSRKLGRNSIIARE